MKIAIYTITSPLHNEQSVSEVSSGFISDIEKEGTVKSSTAAHHLQRRPQGNLRSILQIIIIFKGRQGSNPGLPLNI